MYVSFLSLLLSPFTAVVFSRRDERGLIVASFSQSTLLETKTNGALEHSTLRAPSSLLLFQLFSCTLFKTSSEYATHGWKWMMGVALPGTRPNTFRELLPVPAGEIY